MKMTKSIHMMEETGGKGTSVNASLPPDASWWKIESNSCSPVDILTVFKRDRAGVENGERYRYTAQLTEVHFGAMISPLWMAHRMTYIGQEQTL